MHFVVRKKDADDNERRNVPSSPYPGVSCSDCKLEVIARKWNKILVNWLTKCVNPDYDMKALTGRWLIEIINRYKDEICVDDIDRALLCSDDLEPFLRYKYPILRLRTLSEESDRPKIIYIMTSILLYHCCINSKNGRVESDICAYLTKDEREMILKFCEYLSDMEITINNVETAIRSAYEFNVEKKKNARRKAVYCSESESESQERSRTSTKSPHSRSVTIVTTPPQTEAPGSSSYTSEDTNYYSSKNEDAAGSQSEGDSVTVLSVQEKEVRKNEGRNRGRGSMNRQMRLENSQDGDFSRSKRRESVDKTRKNEDIKNYSSRSFKSSEGERVEVNSDSTLEISSRSSNLSRKYSRNDSLRRPKKKKNQESEGQKSRIRNNFLYKAMENFLLKFGRINVALLSYLKYHLKWTAIIMSIILLLTIIYVLINSYSSKDEPDPFADHKHSYDTTKVVKRFTRAPTPIKAPEAPPSPTWGWDCEKGLCLKTLASEDRNWTYPCLSRCILLCSGPQIWPYPIGKAEFGNEFVSLTTERLEHKFEIVKSDAVDQYLSEAFKLFLGELSKLERMSSKYKNRTHDIVLRKMKIIIVIESDQEPKLRINTDESYLLTTESVFDKLKIKIESQSFAGVRHGLETLSQMILLDQSTGYLISVDKAYVKDGPSYKYRGLMLDTARNFIPIPDILKTVDGMAACKLNTFHWRITDAASFPLHLPKLENLLKFGAYSKSMVYAKEDVGTVVNRARVRGIRVLLEVALPSPVGRAWSWSENAECRKTIDNDTCDNVMCTRLKLTDKVLDMIQHLYTEIIEMTGVDDIFHMSNGFFAIFNCFGRHDNRKGFLDKALNRLRFANKGFMPKLPLIWYSDLLRNERDAKVWDGFGVQIHDWPEHTPSLRSFKVIHSSKWDLSCEIKKQRCVRYRPWQQLYSWNSWRTIESFSIEGGEALLWTDLVDSGNLDFHLWPRAAAVAERLWSDIVINTTVTGEVFYRLDHFYRRRLLLLGLKAPPIWPMWCSLNPKPCIEKLEMEKNKK